MCTAGLGPSPCHPSGSDTSIDTIFDRLVEGTFTPTAASARRYPFHPRELVMVSACFRHMDAAARTRAASGGLSAL